MAPTPAQQQDAQAKYDAATAALQRVKAKNAALAQKTAQDWLGAGFLINSTVKADLAMIKSISASDAAIIERALGDPNVRVLALQGFLSPALNAVGAVTADAAGRVAKLPETTLAATAAGLQNAFQGGILGFLTTLLNPNTWLRVAEVVLGALLIVVGLLRLTDAINKVGSATAVGRVAKALK